MTKRIGIRGYRGDSPWGRGRLKEPPTCPSQWDRLLLRLGLDHDKDALEQLQKGGGLAPLIASWVRKHGDSIYVPSKVLEQVGWSSRWDN